MKLGFDLVKRGRKEGRKEVMQAGEVSLWVCMVRMRRY
jgi:hypothetical protein